MKHSATPSLANTQELCALGQQFLQARNSKDARRQFKLAVAADPNCAAALIGLGTIHLQFDIGCTQLAIAQFEKALEFSTQTPLTQAHAHIGLGLARLDQAERLVDRWNFDRALATSSLETAQAHFAQARSNPLIEPALRAQALIGWSKTQYLQANKLGQQKGYQRAIPALLEGLQLIQTKEVTAQTIQERAMVHALLGKALKHQERFASAVEHLTQAKILYESVGLEGFDTSLTYHLEQIKEKLTRRPRAFELGLTVSDTSTHESAQTQRRRGREKSHLADESNSAYKRPRTRSASATNRS